MDTTISVDFRFQDFKRFSSVPLNFSKTEAIDEDVRTPAEERLIFDFRNSYQIAFGAQKALKPDLTVRAGYWFDRTPVVDKSVGPLFPDANRHGFSVGATKAIGDKEFSLFYEGLKFVDRTTAVPENNIEFTNGDYRNFAHVIGMGMRFNFGGSK
jgi:long-chain fatty acid transport protein